MNDIGPNTSNGSKVPPAKPMKGAPSAEVEYKRIGDISICTISAPPGELALALRILAELIEADAKPV